MSKTKKLTVSAIFTSLAIVISIAESYIPFNLLVPGAKIGFANMVPLILLYTTGPVYAVTVQFLRIIITGIARGNSVMFLFSLFGGMSSIGVSVLLKKIGKPEFSIVGISVVSALIHNIAQFFTALVILKNIDIIWYIAVLSIFGVTAGFITGITAKYMVKLLKKHNDADSKKTLKNPYQ